MKTTKKHLKKIIESYLKETPGDSLGSINEKKYKNPLDAFKYGKKNGDYSIPELALLWYQSVGKGKDLNFFGAGGEFNNHPDADAFKNIILEIGKERFKNDSFNVIIDQVVTNAIVITAGNTYGERYSKGNVVQILKDIVAKKNNDMKDHVMVTLGQSGVDGKNLVRKNKDEEVIRNPNQNNQKLKFFNRYDFGFMFRQITKFAKIEDIEDYAIEPEEFTMIIEIDAPNFPFVRDAPISRSGLRTGNEGYKEAKERNLIAGDKVDFRPKEIGDIESEGDIPFEQMP